VDKYSQVVAHLLAFLLKSWRYPCAEWPSFECEDQDTPPTSTFISHLFDLLKDKEAVSEQYANAVQCVLWRCFSERAKKGTKNLFILERFFIAYSLDPESKLQHKFLWPDTLRPRISALLYSVRLCHGVMYLHIHRVANDRNRVDGHPIVPPESWPLTV
jgi:hypothetical protein